MMTLKKYIILFSTLLLLSQPSPKSEGQDSTLEDTATRTDHTREAVRVVGKDTSVTKKLVHIKDSLERRKIELFSTLLKTQKTLTQLHKKTISAKKYTKIYKDVVIPIYVPVAEADLYTRLQPEKKKDTVSPFLFTPEKTLPKKKGFFHRLFSKNKTEDQ